LAGTWATLPVGHPGQPLNTFWQLMFQPVGSSSWSDRVEGTGVATNGGLVLGTNARLLVVGARPSQYLTYSPLLATTSSGRSWSTGLLANGLAQVPGALAISPSGTALALARGRRGGREVLVSHPGKSYLVSWEVLASSRPFASTTSAQGCSPRSFTAVGYAGTAPVVGADCQRAAAAGLFSQLRGHWAPEGPHIPQSARAEVLDLVPTGAGLAALIELNERASATKTLLAAWSLDGSRWRGVHYLRLPAQERLVSVGPAGLQGVFALMRPAAGQERLAVVSGPGSRTWQYLPTPPPGAQTVTMGPSGQAQALAPNRSAIEVWDLAGASRPTGGALPAGWRPAQVVPVSSPAGAPGLGP
jgi:hypothetical protein